MAVKTIRRDKVRGKHLDHDCYKAYISRHEYGPDDPRVFCYGLIDPMNDELIDKCRNCGAYVGNAMPYKEAQDG